MIDFTDHTPCFVTLKWSVNNDERELTKISFRLIKDTYTNNFLSAVGGFDWNEIFCEDVNITFKKFCFILDEIYCNKV